jgi:membrane-bound serine protease (ClpP class)
VSWAVQAVAEARSSPANQAVELDVVDGIAGSLDEVLAFANGRFVEVAGQTMTLDLTDATITEVGMSPFLQFIRLLSDPTIAFLLFTAGSAGLLAELYSPNFVTGILGALALILALIGLGSLPLNVGGLLLIVLGLVLIGLELTVTSHGLLGFGGIVCFALGASALFTAPVDPFEPLVRVATPLIVVITATFGALMILVVVSAIRLRRMGPPPILDGVGVVRGMLGIVRSPLEPLGSVYISGEDWSARSVNDQPIARGTQVKVVEVDGLTVLVEPEPMPSQA